MLCRLQSMMQSQWSRLLGKFGCIQAFVDKPAIVQVIHIESEVVSTYCQGTYPTVATAVPAFAIVKIRHSDDPFGARPLVAIKVICTARNHAGRFGILWRFGLSNEVHPPCRLDTEIGNGHRSPRAKFV